MSLARIRLGIATTTAVLVLWLAAAGLVSASSSSASTSSGSGGGKGEFVTRKGNQLWFNGSTLRFSGPNIYWLGLDQNVPPGVVAYPTKYRIDDALRTAKGMGAKVVRSHTLGISTGNPLSFEPKLNVWNYTALKTVDYAVHRAGQLGLKLIIPLTDNYHYYHGGKHDFTDWYGLPEYDFYTNATVVQAFKNYIFHLLNHTNRYNGKRYCEDDAVLAWETGNELFPPANWTAAIAEYLKSIAPDQLVLSGRYGVNPEELPIPQVDLYSCHYYPLVPSSLVYESNLTATHDKVFVAGEFGSTYNTSFNSFVKTAETFLPVTGALYWDLFPHLDTYGFEQHGDGFTQHYPAEGSPWKRNRSEALQALAWTMSKETPRPFSVEVAPVLHNVTFVSNNGTQHQQQPQESSRKVEVSLTWRGSAGACRYQLYRQRVGDKQPTMISSCVDDDELPYLDTTLPPSPAAPAPAARRSSSSQQQFLYFVIPLSCSGVEGPPSNIVLVQF